LYPFIEFLIIKILELGMVVPMKDEAGRLQFPGQSELHSETKK
jgi:hypothetical protein